MASMPAVISLPPDGGRRLERWSLGHLDGLMVAIEASLPELQVWMPWATPPPSREVEAAVIEEAVAQFDADEDFAYMLVEGDADAVIGGVGLHPMGDGVFGIGYWPRTDRVGHGIVTTAVSALARTAIHSLNAKAIEIQCDRSNVRSAAIPRRLGFTLVSDATQRPVLTPGHTGVGLVWRAIAGELSA